jgi:hypothetical protein
MGNVIVQIGNQYQFARHRNAVVVPLEGTAAYGSVQFRSLMHQRAMRMLEFLQECKEGSVVTFADQDFVWFDSAPIEPLHDITFMDNGNGEYCMGLVSLVVQPSTVALFEELLGRCGVPHPLNHLSGDQSHMNDIVRESNVSHGYFPKWRFACLGSRWDYQPVKIPETLYGFHCNWTATPEDKWMLYCHITATRGISGMSGLFRMAGSDKVPPAHDYDLLYRMFNAGPSLLEIGYGAPGRGSLNGGASHRVMSHLFHILSIDIDPQCKGENVIIGNSTDPDFWKAKKNLISGFGPFGIIIDDGSHNPEDQRETMRHALPFLNPDGVYIVEDCWGDFTPPFPFVRSARIEFPTNKNNDNRIYICGY